MVFSNAKSGLSAKQMERVLAVTYKCAWRMLFLIRKTLRQAEQKLFGYVESDGAYFGGRKKAGKDNKYLSQAFQAKTAALGAIQRGGNLKVEVVPNFKAAVVTNFMSKNIEKSGTLFLTDGGKPFQKPGFAYDHHSVDHHRGEYVRGYVHVNSMENFWSHSKRSITGVYKKVSKKHAQSYLNAFVFHYNNRYNDRKRFETLIQIVLLSAKKPETAISSSKQYTPSEKIPF